MAQLYDNHKSHRIIITQNWIKNVVIAMNFCPFAAKPFYQGDIGYFVCETIDADAVLQQLDSILQKLDEGCHETAFLILGKDLHFGAYLDLLQLLESYIQAKALIGIYQIASFHPDYCFEGEDSNDPANYTNRSPYGMFHILKESSLTQAVDTYPNVDEIPDRNIERARQVGLSKMQSLFKALK